MKNVRTRTLKKHVGGNLKLSANDRAFLHDLSIVGIIDEHSANHHHYSNVHKDAAKRLDRLCEYGVLERTMVHQRGKGSFKSYTFANDKVAKLFGGKRLILGGRRNAHHEVILSKIYFAEGRPESFKVESQLTSKEKDLFKKIAPTGSDYCLPDAIYYDEGGELVAVEADSGQYTQSQVKAKQTAWTGLKQVWGQPQKASARVHNATLHRFA